MRYISEALDQYTGICKEALHDCASKLSKSFESVIIEVLLLYMVIPGKINFTQMGRYGRHCEQCYRQNFGLFCENAHLCYIYQVEGTGESVAQDWNTMMSNLLR